MLSASRRVGEMGEVADCSVGVGRHDLSEGDLVDEAVEAFAFAGSIGGGLPLLCFDLLNLEAESNDGDRLPFGFTQMSTSGVDAAEVSAEEVAPSSTVANAKARIGFGPKLD